MMIRIGVARETTMTETFTTRDRPGSPTETFTGASEFYNTERTRSDGIDDGSMEGPMEGWVFLLERGS